MDDHLHSFLYTLVGLHHDVEYVAHRGATGVSGGHLHRYRLHIRSRRRAREGPRGGVEAQPRGQIRVVTLRRRVDQRVAGVRIVERVRRDFVAEIRARRRCLVRDGVRNRRGGVGGDLHLYRRPVVKGSVRRGPQISIRPRPSTATVKARKGYRAISDMQCPVTCSGRTGMRAQIQIYVGIVISSCVHYVEHSVVFRTGCECVAGGGDGIGKVSPISN